MMPGPEAEDPVPSNEAVNADDDGQHRAMAPAKSSGRPASPASAEQVPVKVEGGDADAKADAKADSKADSKADAKTDSNPNADAKSDTAAAITEDRATSLSGNPVVATLRGQGTRRRRASIAVWTDVHLTDISRSKTDPGDAASSDAAPAAANGSKLSQVSKAEPQAAEVNGPFDLLQPNIIQHILSFLNIRCG